MLKSQNRKAAIIVAKKKKKEEGEKKRKQKLTKRGLPLNLKFAFNRFHILRLGLGTREERSCQRSGGGKGWEDLGGARPGSTSGKRKQSSREPAGRAGQGGSWATGKGAGLTARLEGETSGRPAGSGGRSRPCGEGSGERQRRSSIPGD